MLIAHLTDTHIGLASAALAGRADPAQALLLSGDLADAGREQEYTLLLSLLQEELLQHTGSGLRVLAIPGNHDRPDLARRLLGALMPSADDAPHGLACLRVAHGGLHFIGLDTVVAGRSHGELGRAQLDWLARTLQALAGQPVLIFMHHPPLHSGIGTMDACGLLRGRAELGRLVARHGGVQLIAAGHLHRPIVGALGGAPVVVAPSTSHQLDLDLRPGAPLAVRMEPPMIGLYRWSPEHGMACHFSHVQAFDGPYPI